MFMITVPDHRADFMREVISMFQKPDELGGAQIVACLSLDDGPAHVVHDEPAPSRRRAKPANGLTRSEAARTKFFSKDGMTGHDLLLKILKRHKLNDAIHRDVFTKEFVTIGFARRSASSRISDAVRAGALKLMVDGDHYRYASHVTVDMLKEAAFSKRHT